MKSCITSFSFSERLKIINFCPFNMYLLVKKLLDPTALGYVDGQTNGKFVREKLATVSGKGLTVDSPVISRLDGQN